MSVPANSGLTAGAVVEQARVEDLHQLVAAGGDEVKARLEGIKVHAGQLPARAWPREMRPAALALAANRQAQRVKRSVRVIVRTLPAKSLTFTVSS